MILLWRRYVYESPPIFSFLIMVFCSTQTERLRWRRCVYENNECSKVIGLTSAFSHGWWWLVMVMTNKGIPHDICFWEEPGWQPIRYKEATNQRQYANRLLQAPPLWNGWWWLVMVMTNKGIPHDIRFWGEPGWQPIRCKVATNQRQAPPPWHTVGPVSGTVRSFGTWPSYGQHV